MTKKSDKQTGRLSERVRKARRRRDHVHQRKRAATLNGLPEIPAPVATIRIFPKPLKTGTSNVLMPILMETQPKKHVQGQYRLAALAEHIGVALGVHMLLTYHALFVLLGSGKRAKETIQSLRGGPGDIDYWLNRGRKALESRTGFDSEQDVQHWATNKYAGLLAADPPPGAAAVRQFMQVEMEAVRLVSRAYEQAQRTVKARNTAVTIVDSEAATAKLQEGFSHSSTQLPAFEALQVAMFADVNPVELWPHYGAVYDPLFEFGRFAGSVNAGIEVTLRRDQFAFAKAILGATIENPGTDGLWMVLKEVLGRHFSIPQFGFAIHVAEATDGLIRVSRSKRELWVETPTRRHLIAP